MLSIILAIGSFLVTLVVMALIQVGYTFKGKFLIAITSFLLALGGVGAAAVIPLWQTALVLLLLVLCVGYLFDKRFGALLYNQNDKYAEIFVEDHETVEKSSKSNDVIEMKEEVLPEASILNMELEPKTEEKYTPSINDITLEENQELEGMDEDISFLLERDTNLDVSALTDEIEVEENYLLDIESLLAEGEHEKNDVEDDGLLVELETHPLFEIEKNVLPLQENNENDLDEALLEFLHASKEAASNLEDDTLEELDEIKPVNKIPSLNK